MPPARKRKRADEPADEAASSRVLLIGESSAANTKMAAYRREGKLTDVKVRVGGEEFPAHRIVLAANSDFMNALFSSGMRDSDSDVVVLADVTPRIFGAVLDYIYDGRVEVEENQLLAILEAAAKLQMALLQESVLAQVMTRVVPENALSLWILGEQLALDALVTASTEVALKNFDGLALG